MSEEQAQQLLYQMQMLESYASNLEQKDNAILAYLREATSSIQSIRGLQNKEAESLIPVGLGTYLNAKVLGDSKVLQDIGAGVVVEKDPETAVNYLETRIKELQVVLNETRAQRQDVMMRLEQLKDHMNSFIQSDNPAKQ